MGTCFSHQTAQQRIPSDLKYKEGSSNLNPKQQFLLRLIYNDLKQRIPEKGLNVQNFLLFFHKNGFWGTRLFQQFAQDCSHLITEDEFLSGMGKLMKTDDEKKVELLFKFFSTPPPSSQTHLPESTLAHNKNNISDRNSPCQNKGVKFNDFLLMLYNYPKEDLKEILNDREFFEKQIRNSLVTIEQKHRLDSVYNVAQWKNKKDSIVCRIVQKAESEQTGIDEVQQQEIGPSMVGKDILRQLKQRQTDQTTLKLKDGQRTLQVRTNNIHHLVKKFTMNMFKSFNLDINNGELNLQQFSNWIKNHNTLFQNYYDGFHNDIWESDPIAQQPKYLATESEREAICKFQTGLLVTKSHILLKHSVIIVCQEEPNTDPIDIICLEGLEVNKIFQQNQGFGFYISHRDGFYPPKKIFLKNQAIRDDWNESLKYFKGGAIENIFTMGKKIGTGKFSVVYEAVNKETKTQVAIKVIEYKELDYAARKMIAHESSIMQIFCHPLLVQFKSFFQTKTHMYIITELCPGRDLFQFVREYKYLDEKQAAFIIQQVIVGVRYMHSLGIVHRDLKPENVMVSYNENDQKIETVKIIDFGFSNYLSTFNSMPVDQVLAGTPNYIAPELLRGDNICYKSDNFAIGSILYFMLSGNLPFNSVSMTDIFEKTLDGQYSLKGKCWQGVSIKAKNLIDQFLKTDPEERISLQDALKHPWFTQVKQKQKKVKKITLDRDLTQNLAIQSTREISK